MLFRDNRDFCWDFLKKIWISHTFCQFWSTKCKQIGLGTKISIEIFVKIHYFSVEIEKKIEKSTKITNNHKNLDKSRSRPKSTVLAKLIETKSRLTFWNCQDFLDHRDFLDRRDWPFFGVETNRDPQGY